MKVILSIIGFIAVSCLMIMFLNTDTFYRSFPWKITDPNNPKFVAEDFKFTDYKDTETLREALKVMFPIGTPRSKVDKILYEQQPKYKQFSPWGVSIVLRTMHPRKNGTQNIVYYKYKRSSFHIDGYNISVFYDQQNNLQEITDHGYALYNRNFWDKE